MLMRLFSEPHWQRLGLTLLHFLWQGAAIAAVAAVVVAALRHGRARYTAYLLGLIAMVFCPLVTWRQLAPEASTAASPAFVASPIVSAQPLAADAAGNPQPAAANADPVFMPGAPFGRLLPWLVALYFAGVCILSVRLLLGCIGTSRMRASLQPLPPYLVSRAAMLADQLGLKSASVFASPRVDQPLAVGCWRPLVLVPLSLVSSMPVDMLEAVIAHELAHIRRHDLWVNLLQRIVETLLFYHPCVWWISARIRAEREICCDALAVQATGQPLEFVEALEHVAHGQVAGLAAGLTSGRRTLLMRIRHILGLPQPASRPNWPAGLLALLLVTIALAPRLPASSAPSAASPTNPATQPVPAAQLDLSTPAAAWKAYNHASSSMDADALVTLTWVKFDPADLRRFWSSDPADIAIYNKAQRDAELVAVVTHHDDLAVVISLLKFPPGVGRDPYSLRFFGRMDGQWKNLGEDRCPSEQDARDTFDRKKEKGWEHWQQMKKDLAAAAPVELQLASIPLLVQLPASALDRVRIEVPATLADVKLLGPRAAIAALKADPATVAIILPLTTADLAPGDHARQLRSTDYRLPADVRAADSPREIRFKVIAR